MKRFYWSFVPLSAFSGVILAIAIGEKIKRENITCFQSTIAEVLVRHTCSEIPNNLTNRGLLGIWKCLARIFGLEPIPCVQQDFEKFSSCAQVEDSLYGSATIELQRRWPFLCRFVEMQLTVNRLAALRAPLSLATDIIGDQLEVKRTISKAARLTRRFYSTQLRLLDDKEIFQRQAANLFRSVSKAHMLVLRNRDAIQNELLTGKLSAEKQRFVTQDKSPEVRDALSNLLSKRKKVGNHHVHVLFAGIHLLLAFLTPLCPRGIGLKWQQALNQILFGVIDIMLVFENKGLDIPRHVTDSCWIVRQIAFTTFLLQVLQNHMQLSTRRAGGLAYQSRIKRAPDPVACTSRKLEFDSDSERDLDWTPDLWTSSEDAEDSDDSDRVPSVV